jgi:NADH-quinone oxidoreductase subunit G
MVGGAPVEWDQALDEAAKRLKALVAKGNIGVVFSAQATNEDLHVLARLAADGLNAKQLYLSGLDQGWSDDILVSADKNPNTAGAKAIAGASVKTLVDLSRDLKAGALSGLLVLGDTGVLGKDEAAGLSALPVGKLDTLVLLATHQGPLVDAAHVALPLSMWAEVDGTITNKQGKVQRMRPGIEAAGDSLPGWEILVHLGQRLGMTLDLDTAKKVFLAAKAAHGFMKDADWGRPILPVQLRFANTRG